MPALVAQGHSTLKVFMTYDLLNVGDEGLLDILLAARQNKALVCVHAENHGMISWMGKKLVEKGYTAPKYHTVSHPRGCEAEAFTRLIAFAEFIDQPIMIFHVSTAEGVEVIRQARGRGLKVFAETCPQYLFMTAKDLDKPGIEGAKWMCSPPPRTEADQEAIWQGLALGDLQVVSSDHAPYAFDATGKLSAGPNPNFKQIANGLPGIEVRLPLLFDAMVSKGRLGLAKFVELTATAPAKIYNLHPAQGLDRHRRRRRSRDLGPQAQGHPGRRHAARPHGLHALRRAHDHGLARDGAASRRGRRPLRQARRQTRLRRLPAARRRRRGRPAQPPHRRHGPGPQLRRPALLRRSGGRLQLRAGAMDERGRPIGQPVAADIVDILDGHEPGRELVAAGHGLAGQPSAAVHGDEVVGDEGSIAAAHDDIVDIDEARKLRLDAGLLAHLAHGRGPRRLARLDVAAGQAPQARERALSPLDEQHRGPAEDGGAGGAARPSWGSLGGVLRALLSRFPVSRHAPAA